MYLYRTNANGNHVFGDNTIFICFIYLSFYILSAFIAFAIFSVSESFLTSTSNAAVHFSVFISTVFPILRHSEAISISLDTFVSLRYSNVNPLNPASFFLSAAIRSSNCKQAYSQSVLASSNLASSEEYSTPPYCQEPA